MKWNARFRLQAWLVSPLILSLLILSGCTAPAIPDGAWMAPTDVDSPTQPNYLELGWQSFIAFNWPAVTGSGAYPGQPDKNMNITNPAAAKSPTVWLTWMMPEQVFLPQAANPGLWNAPTVALPMKEDPVTGTMLPVIGGMSKFSAGANDDEFDEAFSNNPLIDQQGNYVFYDVRMNESEFTYLSLTSYYNARKQIDDVQANPTKFVPLPKTGKDLPPSVPPTALNDWAQFGATEIKASWRILVDGKDNPSRYYTMRAYVALPDGTLGGPYSLGLVGFHILRLTPSTHATWFWATFEQVDNLAAPANYAASFNNGTTADCQQNGYSYKPESITYGSPLPKNPAVNVCRVTPIPATVAALNASYQRKLSGTPWQYYQMINTLNPMPGGPCAITNIPNGAAINACEMVNVTMETYTQVKTQCNSCHQLGFPQGNIRPADLGDLQIFTFLLGHAQKPDSTNFKIKLPILPTLTSP
jgi:hypothetical protein